MLVPGFLMSWRRRRTACCIALIALFACFFGSVSGQTQKSIQQHTEYRFKPAFNLGGQPSFSFIQDRDGFLWSGSLSSGLIRFDGQDVKRYKEGAQSLSSNYVTQLLEDSKGLIWIGTNSGLNVYDKSSDKFTAYFHDPKKPDSLANDSFILSSPAIAEDREGRIWFGTRGGLSRLDRGSKQFYNYTHHERDPQSIASNAIHAVHIDSKGDVWLAFSDRGIDRLDPKTGQVEHFRHNPKAPNSIPYDDITAITPGKDGVLWLSSRHHGLVKFDPLTRKFKPYSNEPGNPYKLPKLVVWGWNVLNNGLLTPVQATESTGLVLFNPVTERTEVIKNNSTNPFSIASGGIQGTVEDAQGRLWVSTSSGQVQMYDPKAVPLKLYRTDPAVPASLASNVAIPIYEDRGGRIWIGHFGQGLDLYEPGTDGFRHFKSQIGNPKSLPHNYPTGFLEDENGNFYVSTFSGVALFDRQRMEVVEHVSKNTSYYSLVQDLDQPDLIWATGWESGLCSFHRVTKKTECFRNNPVDSRTLSNDTALRMIALRDQPKYLWLATWGGGLERFDRTTRSFKHFQTDRKNLGSLSSNTVYDLREDSKGRLWVATANGLNLFDKATETFTRITTDTGFPASVVHNIQEDDAGDLWLGSDVGLIRFDPNARVVKKIFTVEDGLHSNEFFATSSLKTRDGRLFFGGFKGLNVLRPTDIQENSEIPRIFLTAVRQNGKEVHLSQALERVQSLSFDAENSSFDFDFIALGFTNAAQNQYAYRLEGLDKDWQMMGTRRTGRYSKLPPGNFVLHIKASNNDGIWNEKGLRIAVTIVPPFWRTIPFYLLMVAMGCGLVYLFYRVRVVTLKRQNQHLELLISHRTQELQSETQRANEAAETKSLFLANMSHEIRTPMNAIIGLAHLVSRTDLTDRQRDYLRKIEQSGRHLLGILNDILDFSKVESGKLSIESVAFELDNLVQEVATVVAPKAQEKGLEFICVIEPNVPQRLMGDPLRLSQILINYLNNAVKFTTKGELVMRIEVLDGLNTQADTNSIGLKFSVQDSGIGLTPIQISHLFQSFSQADASTTRKFGGTGLGLAISKRLAELMGGGVGVESEVGKGATFWFTALLGRSTQTLAATNRKLNLGGQRAIVVDDHVFAAETIALQLEQLGLRVDRAHSGREALEMIQNAFAAGNGYSFAFVDWQMPDWDGLVTAEKITALGLNEPPKVIIVTGHGKDEILQAAESAGLNEILLKPVSSSTLFDSLLRVTNSPDGKPMAYQETNSQSSIFSKLAGLRGAQILLVEDNELNQQVATELLSIGGFVVDIAGNGQIALDRVAEKQYDLILMDMQMPVMDGVTATTRLRENPQNRDLPIIAMTANAMQSDRDRCIAAGMNGFVTKPIEPDHLAAALLQWIAPREGLGEKNAPVATPSSISQIGDEPVLIEKLKQINGLDVERGVKRMMGNQGLYLNLIQRFVDSQESAFTEMTQSYRRGDLILMERQAHTLKGLAGNVGAEDLQNSAAAIETAVRENDDAQQIHKKLEALSLELHKVVMAVREILPLPASATAIDKAEQAHLLAELRQLLVDEDPGALALLQGRRDAFRDLLGDRYASVLAALEQFDFDDALSAMNKI